MTRPALTLRGRVALATVGLCALALMLFAGGAWWSIKHAHETRLDANLTAELLRALARPRQGAEWQRYFNSLSSVFPPGDGSPPVMRALGAGSNSRFDSAGAPPAIAGLELPQPEARPERREHPPPRRADAPSAPGFGPPPDGDRPGPPGPPPSPDRPPPPDRPPLDADWDPGQPPPPPPPESNGQRPAPKIGFQNVVDGGKTWRVAIGQTRRATVMIAVDRRAIDSELRPVERAFLFAIPLTLALVGWASWLVARPTLVSVRRLSGSVQKVSAEALDHRLDANAFDPELQQLVTTFNHTLDRLERSFASARRFSADVAHELKTPLAVLQGEMELALHAEPDGSVAQQRLSGLLTHVRRLDGIVRKLKLLAQADAGQIRLIKETVDLAEIIAELAEDAASLTPSVEMTLELPDGLRAPVDADLFMQAVRNLLTNAVKYNRPGGWVHVAATSQPGNISIRVANSRPANQTIDPEQIFERFWRGDTVGRIEGSGLGLALTREIARAHGGDCVVSRLDAEAIEITLTIAREK